MHKVDPSIGGVDAFFMGTFAHKAVGVLSSNYLFILWSS